MNTGKAETYLRPAPNDTEQTTIHQKLIATLGSIAGLVKASTRPLPTQYGDGSYPNESKDTGLLKDVATINVTDLQTLADLAKTQLKSTVIDDGGYLMERIIQLASDLPSTSRNGKLLEAGFINVLWNDLRHPPISRLGEGDKYRMADGSRNNVLWPELGAAGTPYARSVSPSTEHLQALHKPDAGVLFDALMARSEFEPHPNKISSVLFYLATLIIHDIFKTSHEDMSVSLSSSYLDLGPLYGNNQQEQNAVRTFQAGHLKPDCFSDTRILGFPPGVSVLLIMFNRFHNYIADSLAMINENNRFTKPSKSASEKAWVKYDNDLFQTARLITCGLYVNIILKDYVRVILNLHRTESTWGLDPRVKDEKFFGMVPAAMGTGNQVSAEFNFVYRWHSTVSERDDKWTREFIKAQIPGVDPEKLSATEMIQALSKWEHSLHQDPQKRCFPDLERDAAGRLPDQPLVTILQDSIEDVAGAFGANRVPVILRAVEILGIEQSRSWNLATLNECRAFFNLAPHKTFEDINPDPKVADQLRHLYGTPDLVELYPGLVVEAAKEPMTPGSGLCPGFTVSRAVLSDAVALVRGDRFYTTDYTPSHLTNFGVTAVGYNNEVDQGHVFYKLILRAFPHHFKGNSAYAHWPLVVPSETQSILQKLGTRDLYDFDAPKYIPTPRMINSYETGTRILKDQTNYHVTWGKTITHLMQNSGYAYGSDFMLSGDDQHCTFSRQLIGGSLYQKGWERDVRAFYKAIVTNLLKKKSYQIAGENEVDIIRDVGNLSHVHFAAEAFSLPLKTEQNPLQPFSEKEMYIIMALVFMCIFFDQDPVQHLPLITASRKATQQLGQVLEQKLSPLTPLGAIEKVKDWFHTESSLPLYGRHMIRQLLRSQLGLKDIVWSQILGTAGGMVAIQGQVFAQVLDFYLRPENKENWAKIQELAREDNNEADDMILRYLLEASRIVSSVALPRIVQKDTVIVEDGQKIQLKAGDEIVVNLVSCSHDAKKFPNPTKIDITRPLEDYIHYGWGPHQCMGMNISKIALTTMLKTVANLKNLRRAPGAVGKLQTIKVEGGFSLYLTEDGSSLFPFPQSMKVRWDGDVELTSR